LLQNLNKTACRDVSVISNETADESGSTTDVDDG